MFLSGFNQKLNGGREPVPAIKFTLELFPTRARQCIDLRRAPKIGILPLGAKPALLFESMERRVQRTLADRENVAGKHLNALRDSPAMKRVRRNGLKYQEI